MGPLNTNILNMCSLEINLALLDVMIMSRRVRLLTLQQNIVDHRFLYDINLGIEDHIRTTEVKSCLNYLMNFRKEKFTKGSLMFYVDWRMLSITLSTIKHSLKCDCKFISNFRQRFFNEFLMSPMFSF